MNCFPKMLLNRAKLKYGTIERRGATNEGLFSNSLQGTRLKYVAMQLNTFVNFIRKFESDVT